MSEGHRDNHTNCTPAGIHEFPNLLTAAPPRYDLTFYATMLAIYLFLALAIVCDEYFVPAVERFCYKLHMSFDIAGATFMAAASSSPEFFVDVVGTFITKGDMGIGTILGSSVFNILAVPAVCGIWSGVTVALDWWPLTRDLIWYFIAIISLTCMISDGTIEWNESVTLVVLYFVNLAVLLLDRQVQKVFRGGERSCKLKCFQPAGEIPDLEGAMDEDPNEGTEDEIFQLFEYPKEESIYEKIMWVISWPIQFVFFLTIPNCRRVFFREWFAATLIMCMVWISSLSYLISWFMTVVGFNLFIPDSIMGITFLAAGASIPEAVGSLVVVRKGYGSMFICNCISSNTFDIFICLGVPWLIRNQLLLHEGEITTKIGGVVLNSSGLFYITGSLVCTCVILYVSFMFTTFTMNETVGWICMVGYFAYVIYCILIELNVFGIMNLPICGDPHPHY